MCQNHTQAQLHLLDDVPKPPQRWRPPDNGLVKVNFDGAFNSEDNRGGLGVVIRNGNGVMGAKVSNITNAKLLFG
ncbi:hypothetical protein CRYUN_Cryun27aG0019900 [Craigia yunnanensis]